jgi:hypothetical protein
MKFCDDCKHAIWERTEAGKLHPSKQGQCNYKWELPPLPVAFSWFRSPVRTGGGITRKRENVEHCVYWARAEGKKQK